MDLRSAVDWKTSWTSSVSLEKVFSIKSRSVCAKNNIYTLILLVAQVSYLMSLYQTKTHPLYLVNQPVKSRAIYMSIMVD